MGLASQDALIRYHKDKRQVKINALFRHKQRCCNATSGVTIFTRTHLDGRSQLRRYKTWRLQLFSSPTASSLKKNYFSAIENILTCHRYKIRLFFVRTGRSIVNQRVRTLFGRNHLLSYYLSIILLSILSIIVEYYFNLFFWINHIGRDQRE